MQLHPIIRDEIARIRQEDLLRDGAQPPVAAAQQTRRARLRVVLGSYVEALAVRLSVRRAVRRHSA